MQREELTALLARVEAATGPDREVDARLCQALAIEPWIGWWATQSPVFTPRSSLDRDTPRLTGSTDVALALVERLRPGWCPELIRKRSADPEHWGCKLSEQWASYAAPKLIGHGPTAPLAILAALLKALLATTDTGGVDGER